MPMSMFVSEDIRYHGLAFSPLFHKTSSLTEHEAKLVTSWHQQSFSLWHLCPCPVISCRCWKSELSSSWLCSKCSYKLSHFLSPCKLFWKKFVPWQKPPITYPSFSSKYILDDIYKIISIPETSENVTFTLANFEGFDKYS